MARATITLDGGWVQIASGACVVSIKEQGAGRFYLNDTGADANAMRRTPDPEDQFQQTEEIATFAKSEDDSNPYVIIVDGTL